MPEISDRPKALPVAHQHDPVKPVDAPANSPVKASGHAGNIQLKKGGLPDGALYFREINPSGLKPDGSYNGGKIFWNAVIGGCTMASTFGFLGALNSLTRQQCGMGVRMLGAWAPVVAGTASLMFEMKLEEKLRLSQTLPPNGPFGTDPSDLGWHALLPICFMGANIGYSATMFPKKFPVTSVQGFLLTVSVSAFGSFCGKGLMEVEAQRRHKALLPPSPPPGMPLPLLKLEPPRAIPGERPVERPADRTGERTSQTRPGAQTPTANQIALARGLTQVIPFSVNVAAALKYRDLPVSPAIGRPYIAAIGISYIARGAVAGYFAKTAESDSVTPTNVYSKVDRSWEWPGPPTNG